MVMMMMMMMMVMTMPFAFRFGCGPSLLLGTLKQKPADMTSKQIDAGVACEFHGG